MASPLVRLRPVLPTDSARLLKWRNLPEVRQYMYTDHEISEAEHAAWFARIADDRRRRYWIIEADKAPVGLVNLCGIDWKQKRAAWAFYIGETSVRGKGIGSAVEREIIRIAFGEMGLEKLTCEVLASNESVCRLHERHGFQHEGLLRSHVIKDGERVDVVIYGLLKSSPADAIDADHARRDVA